MVQIKASGSRCTPGTFERCEHSTQNMVKGQYYHVHRLNCLRAVWWLKLVGKFSLNYTRLNCLLWSTSTTASL